MVSRRSKADLESVAWKGAPLRIVLRLLGLALLIVGITAVAHWPVLNAKAISFDDGEYLTENELVQNPSWTSASRFLTEVLKPSTVKGYYQPLTMISLMLDYAAADRIDNLRPFHRTSLILHMANTLLLMGLLYMLFGRPWIAAGVALLFGVHPMTVEPIAWIGERKTLLATFFSLLCLLTYVRYTRKGDWKLYTTCVALYVLALMSKPTSTPIPLVLLLLDFWPLRRMSKSAVVEKVPFFLIAAVSVVVTIVSQRHLKFSKFNAFTIGQTLLLICHNLIFYPSKMVWPMHLSSLYPFPEEINLSDVVLLTSTIACTAIGICLLISLRWTRALVVGGLCYCVLLGPTLLNKSYSPSIAWDKYAYLPAIGLLIVLAWFLMGVAGGRAKGCSKWRPLAVGFGVMWFAVLLMVGSRRYIRQWQTTQRHEFYMHDLAPDSPITNMGCGNVFLEKGAYERAIGFYTRAIEAGPDFAQAYINRGNTYSKIRDYGSAIKDFTKAIGLQPTWVAAYNNRGTAYNRKGEFQRAIDDFNRVIEQKPGFVEAYNNRGVAYGDLHNYHQAIQDYSRAIAMKPDHALAYNNRAVAYYRLQQYDRAWADLKKCQQLGGPINPAFIQALTEASSR